MSALSGWPFCTSQCLQMDVKTGHSLYSRKSGAQAQAYLHLAEAGLPLVRPQ